LVEALGFYRSALGLARHDPDLEQTVDEISRALEPKPAPVDDGMSFAEAQAEFLAALDGFEALGAAEHAEELAEAAAHAQSAVEPDDILEGAPESPELHELERVLDAIHSYRQRRALVGV
jgi:hypothetical protein